MAVRAKPGSEDRGTEGSGFRTLSGEPVRELYTHADLPAGIGGLGPGLLATALGLLLGCFLAASFPHLAT